jgi:outer membrane protein assembly factor BamB
MPITSSASEEPGMPPSSTLEPRRLRLWPAIGISFLMLAACFGTGFVIPGTIPQFMAMLWGPMIGGPLMVLWWLFFSRAPWTDRVVGLALLAAVAAATYYLAHPTAKPLGLLINGVPTVSAIMVAWLWLMDGRVSQSIQRWSSAVLLIIATGIWGCIRVDGIDGSLSSYLSWRWSPTKEEQFLASSPKEDIPDAAVASTEPLVAEPGDWPGFRGLQRDSIVSNQKFVTDWKSNPPKEIWRRPIGPAWSSFCVIGNLAFTQEQRDQEEAVVCYDTENGAVRWRHTYPARFTELVSGVGPRATPTFHEGGLYTVGAKGTVSALDAASGQLIWSRDLVQDTKAGVPEWGFSSSPLVIGELVVVHGGGDLKEVIAYDRLSGEPRWTAEAPGSSYSSPHLFETPGGPQILMVTAHGMFSLSPVDGTLIWNHEWEIEMAARIVQPGVVKLDADTWGILIATGYGHGTRLVKLSQEGDTWNAEEEWTSRSLKPYFNDFVIRDGYIYGFDGNILTCVDLESGDRRWKQGRYGHGQLILSAENGVLFILSEHGELALVEANPEQYQELAQFQAMQGKTWNHPVLAHGKLLVRNAEEIVCYEMPLEGPSESLPTAADSPAKLN